VNLWEYTAAISQGSGRSAETTEIVCKTLVSKQLEGVVFESVFEKISLNSFSCIWRHSV